MKASLKETSWTNTLPPELLNTIICDDAIRGLSKLPDRCISTIITSPPYYLQRDYSHPEQLGNEHSVKLYIEKLLKIFQECFRVLSDEGTLWLNLGDKYLDGCLLGVPWRVALALQNEGWILRSDIIWYKPNAMPSSVKNRPTTDHEYIFLFSKKDDYYYDADAVREPHVTFTEKSRMRGGRNHFGKRGGTPEQGKNQGNSNLHNARWDQAFHPNGRNRRTVWEIPLSKFPEAHFAVFPERLVELCILAGSRPNGVVLDPFIGSGTTALVAQRLGRAYLGIDCNPAYCEMARKRTGQNVFLPLTHSSDTLE
jgi:site-specific DNA-methyltransferase (adenine-specific)